MAKVNIQEFFGNDINLGALTAVVGMETNYGRINAISGNLIDVGSGTAQSRKWMYDEHLSITRAHAEVPYAWPTGVGSESFSHSGVYPKNNVMNVAAASGFTYWNGSTAITVGR